MEHHDHVERILKLLGPLRFRILAHIFILLVGKSGN